MSDPMDHALILEPDTPLQADRVGLVLAYHLDLRPTDAVLNARYCGGILVERAQREVLEEIAARLAEIGIATRIVPSSDLDYIASSFRAVNVQLEPGFLIARSVTGRKLLVPRTAIHGFHLYGILDGPRGPSEAGDASALERKARRIARGMPLPLEAYEQGVPGGVSPRGRVLLEKLQEAQLQDLRFHLSLYCSQPVDIVRIGKENFDFSCLGVLKQAHSLDNFLFLLEELLAYVPDAWNRAAIEEFLRTLDPEPIFRFRPQEVDNFDRWMVEWVRLRSGRMEGETV